MRSNFVRRCKICVFRVFLCVPYLASCVRRFFPSLVLHGGQQQQQAINSQQAYIYTYVVMLLFMLRNSNQTPVFCCEAKRWGCDFSGVLLCVCTARGGRLVRGEGGVLEGLNAGGRG